MRLFDRIGRSVKLTSQGEDLLVRSRRLLSDADSLGERARALKSGHTGVLQIGGAPQIWKICSRTSRSVTASVIRA